MMRTIGPIVKRPIIGLED